jgi:glycerol-3-phosphate dehydrogenase (NAD(P)+)
MRIAMLGAGAWGTALAQHAARRHDTVLWSRERAVLDDIVAERVNRRYLPEVLLAPSLAVEAALARAVADADLVVIATPVAALRPMLEAVRALGAADTATLCWVCKGLESGTGLLPHQVASAVLGRSAGATLSGPSFAHEVGLGLPVALTAAGASAHETDRLVAAFHHDAMRVYASSDRIGVEVGGAVKNVMAIATGISDGLGLGANARAALMTRGLAEIRRFAVASGAQAETLMGLSGLGDLVLTCTGDLSRNRRVGLRLAAGVALDRILAELGHVAEGVACCRTVVERAAALGVEMPISRAVRDVLEGRASAPEAVQALLARNPVAEGG